jgi:F-type H+-transporting ATPase subunit b
LIQGIRFQLTSLAVEVSMQRMRSITWVLLFFLIPGTFAVTAAPAQAQHGGDGGHGDKTAGHDDAKAGEIDIFKWSLDLGIWTLVVFLLLLFVLTKYAWTPMLEGLRKREEGIRSAIREAEQTRDEAHRLRDQFQAEVNNAHVKVREIMDEARRDAERTTQDMVAKARSEIQTERDRLRREIATARDQALQEIWKQSAQLATLISAKAIGKKLALEDHRRLVDEALGELKEAGAEWQRQGAGTRS